MSTYHNFNLTIERKRFLKIDVTFNWTFDKYLTKRWELWRLMMCDDAVALYL
jgi:hypothetical protein